MSRHHPGARRRRVPALAIVAPVLLALLVAACAASTSAPEAPPAASPTAGAATTAAASPSRGASPTTVAPPSVTIAAVGDVSLARGVVDRMQADGPGYPFALVAPLLDGDINVANLEGPLTDRGEPWPKGYNFRTPPRFASALTAGHIGVVSLANNHIMDFGAVGLADTLTALDAAGIRHAGAGADESAAYAPAVVDVRGLRVAFLGYVATPDEGGGFSIRQWAAGARAPGVAIGAADAIHRDVAAARASADFVIVLLHAGDEYLAEPSATQRALTDAALAAGADSVIGAHAHVPQPIERRGRQLVAWGLGNFVFALDPVDLANIPQPRVSLVLKLTLTRGAGVTSFEVLPVTLDAAQDRPRPATPEEAAVLHRIVDS